MGVPSGSCRYVILYDNVVILYEKWVILYGKKILAYGFPSEKPAVRSPQMHGNTFRMLGDCSSVVLCMHLGERRSVVTLCVF